MSEEAAKKPLSMPLRMLRMVWAVLLVGVLLFSIMMAAWGDLREGLMLKFLDERYVKSFTLQVPDGAKVWLGEEYLGVSVMHPLGAEEPEDDPMKVEGMSVLLPRVYFYEQQLMENSVDCVPGDSTSELLKQLAPEGELLWVQSDVVGEQPEFLPALLKAKDGRLDFVNLCRVDWPARDGGTTRKAFLLRMMLEESHVFVLDRTELWSDQLYAKDGDFWATREQWDDYPPNLSGQTKTVWRLFVSVKEDGVKWLESRFEYDYSEDRWFRLSEKD